MSMRIAERAGISVHVIYRRDRKTETILSVSDGYVPADEFPVRVLPATPQDLENAICAEHIHYAGQPFAMALAQDAAGQSFAFSARAHAAIGYSAEEHLESPDGKYSFVLEPVNRLLMAAARKGLSLQKNLLYSSRVPTARELINMIGADVPAIRIGNLDAARDIFGPQALRQLTEAGIIAVLSGEGNEHAS
jgi:dCMP deaminase